MKQHDLNNLIRMAFEIDELDCSACSAERERLEMRSIPFERANPRPSLIKRLAVPFAAAAALLLAFYPRADYRSQKLNLASGGAFDLAYCPATPVLGGKRVDRFHPSPGEKCSVLAIFHSWQKDCQCLAWQVYEWEDGRSLAELTPDQIHEITLDVTDAPPLEQLLVVLIADRSEDLPVCNPDFCALLDCLNETPPPDDPGDNAASYASAVRSCVPDSVRVVPRAFFVE